MPCIISKNELISVVGGRSITSSSRIIASGVVTDSREIRGGELFIALPGEMRHGHAFVQEAFDRGASLLLVETEEHFPGIDSERCVVVPSTLVALGQLASWWRQNHPIPVLGITGSVGKTTTKELCAAILLAHSQGTYSRKSYNNHVGVPLSLLSISEESEWAVIEMGMNHAGEISALTAMAKPTVAVVSAIAPAHIENLGSLENIVRAKLEIAEGLSEGGLLIINGDSELLVSIARELVPHHPQLAFGHGEDAHLRVLAIAGRGIEGISVAIEWAGERPEPFSVPIMGKHNGMNVAASILATKTLIPALSWDTIRRGLARFTPPDMRLRRYPTSSGMQVIDDSYNANPESMRALLAIARETAEQGREVGLVLGDMLELGDISEDAHREIGRLAAEMNPLFIVAVGPRSEILAEEAARCGASVTWCRSAGEATASVLGMGCDVLFVKASRGTGLDAVVRAVVGPLAES
jgi:UDP-N-acetylmuramoyl-tripeptide--D-alanyl-D-alanine ligase